MRSHNLRAVLANSSGGGGGGGDDLSTAFVEFSNRFIASDTYMGNNNDYDGPYDVAQVQTNFSGAGRIYIGQKNTTTSVYRNDIAIAGIQLLSGSTLVKSWIFNTSSGGTGSTWKTYTNEISGSSSTGFPITPATASGYGYVTMHSAEQLVDYKRFSFASGTGSTPTGAADGIADAYKLSADGGSSTIATVGDAQISQTSNTYYAFRESSSSSNYGCAVMESPEYTFSGGEYIRIIHTVPGYSQAPMDPDDCLYVAVKEAPSLVTSNRILLLDANSYSGSGQWLDTSGSNNHGTITSSDSTLTYVNDGNADYFNFGSGTNRFIMDSGMFNPNQDHTFSIWVRFADWSPGNSNMHSFLAEDNSAGGMLYRYAENSGGHNGMQVVRSYQSNLGTFSNSSGLSHSTIYNFTFTRSSNTFTCYINGVNIHPSTGNSNNTLGTITSSDTSFVSPNNIGSDQNGVDDLEGRVYHVMAYSDALTASEVSQNYNALKGRYGY